MTILGKILVIVNFVFSLIATGLIIAVYASSTNWHSYADKLNAELTKANANAEAFKEERNELAKNLGDRISQLEGSVKSVGKERDDAKADGDRFKKDLDTERNKLNVLTATRESLTGELERRKSEVEKLNNLLTSSDKKMLTIEKEKKDLRDRAVSAELASKSEHERNMNLLAQYEAMVKENERLRSGGSALAGGTKNPPPEDVDGLVKATDPQSGYLTLTIGSDAGLSRGNTLEVYRMNPSPKYLGTVRILDVRPHEAVAKPVPGTTTGPIQAGDHVASNISTRR
jgi:hypothetical protein